MQIFIACNDQPMAARLRSSLGKLGIDVPESHIISYNAAEIATALDHDEKPVLIFFGSDLRAADDLTSLTQLCNSSDRLKVVVVGTGFGASLILQAIRCGAVDCLNLSGDFAVEVRHLLHRMQLASGDRKRPGRLFTVIAPVGGVGTSVLATNLAAAVARREKTCALLDLHWRGGDLATLLNVIPRHTLLSLAGKYDHLDQTMLDQSVVRHECGIHLLASPEPFSDYRQIRNELIQKIVQLSKAAYASVVVDLEDCEHFDQVRTLAASDQVIVPMRPDFVSLTRTKKLLHHLTSASVGRGHIKIVINRTGQPKELSAESIAEALDMPVCLRLPDDPVSINEAINLGVPLVIACPHSKVTAGVVELADSLLGVQNKASPASSPSRKWLKEQLLPLRSLACRFGVTTW